MAAVSPPSAVRTILKWVVDFDCVVSNNSFRSALGVLEPTKKRLYVGFSLLRPRIKELRRRV